MKHEALIEELQAGPGSRELSDRMLADLGWYKTSCYGWVKPDGSYSDKPFPDPTRNLQDAVDLVPEGVIWTLCSDWPGNVYSATTASADGAYTHSPVVDSPALALVIALIKARSLT